MDQKHRVSGFCRGFWSERGTDHVQYEKKKLRGKDKGFCLFLFAVSVVMICKFPFMCSRNTGENLKGCFSLWDSAIIEGLRPRDHNYKAISQQLVMSLIWGSLTLLE